MKDYYFYPLLIIVFLITFHFYSFYQKNFFQMLKLIKSKLHPTLYERIQSENPYYEIWLLSQKSNPVYFIFEDKTDKNLDYNTTYFKNKNKPEKNKINYYLSELKLNIDYYFYPRIIKNFSLYEIVKNQDKIQKNSFIISDYKLDDYWQKINSLPYLYQIKTTQQKEFDKLFSSFYKRLKRLNIQKKQYLSLIRHPEKPYYIYFVIN